MGYFQVTTSEPIVVKYIGETGLDYGGLVREWMMGWQGQGIGE